MELTSEIINYPIFPSIVTEVKCLDYSTIKEDLIEWIYDYKKNNEGIPISNRGGWHSEYDLHRDYTFVKFNNYICRYIQKCTEMYESRFKLESMWININQKGNYNVCHNHSTTLSGVFWVKSPENCGNLTLHSNNSYCENDLIESISSNLSEKYNYYLEFNFVPNDGHMVLFPSHIMHNVDQNESDQDRISIAFDLTCIK